MVKVKILLPTWKDMDNISDYHLEKVGPACADKITDKLLDAIELLESQPLCGTIHPDPVLQQKGYRKLICGEYICIYRLIEETVYVYRIFHGSTNYPELSK